VVNIGRGEPVRLTDLIAAIETSLGKTAERIARWRCRIVLKKSLEHFWNVKMSNVVADIESILN
jgi:hypothetical protein